MTQSFNIEFDVSKYPHISTVTKYKKSYVLSGDSPKIILLSAGNMGCVSPLNDFNPNTYSRHKDINAIYDIRISVDFGKYVISSIALGENIMHYSNNVRQLREDFSIDNPLQMFLMPFTNDTLVVTGDFGVSFTVEWKCIKYTENYKNTVSKSSCITGCHKNHVIYYTDLKGTPIKRANKNK